MQIATAAVATDFDAFRSALAVLDAAAFIDAAGEAVAFPAGWSLYAVSAGPDRRGSAVFSVAPGEKLSGVVTLRCEFTGRPRRAPRQPAVVPGGWQYGMLIVAGQRYASTVGGATFHLGAAFDQYAPVPFFQGPVDTTLFPDGPMPVSWYAMGYFANPASPGAAFPDARLEPVARSWVWFANGSANRVPVPVLADLVLEPGDTLALPAANWLRCDGATGGASSVVWTSTDPAVASVTGTTIANPVGGTCELTATASPTKSGRCRVTVRSNKHLDLPHFKRTGGTTRSHGPDSFIPAWLFMMAHYDLGNGVCPAETIKAAGLTAHSGGFVLSPWTAGWGGSLANYKTQLNAYYDLAMAPWAATGLPACSAGDDIVRQRKYLHSFLYEHSWSRDALRYAVSKMAQGNTLLLRTGDEMMYLYGHDPYNISKDPNYPLIDDATFDLLVSTMREVPGCPMISHPGGGRKWSVPSLADAADIYADSWDGDPERGVSPAGVRARMKLAWNGVNGVGGVPTWCPRIMLWSAAGPYYEKMAQGNAYYVPGQDRLIRAGMSPEGAVSQLALFAAFQCSGVGAYFYDFSPAISGRLNAPVGSLLETGVSPGTDRWDLLSLCFNWIKNHTSRLLAPVVPAPQYGPDWETAARDGGPGRRLVTAGNFGGRPFRCPPAPPGFTAPPKMLTPTGYGQLGVRQVPNGGVVVWEG